MPSCIRHRRPRSRGEEGEKAAFKLLFYYLVVLLPCGLRFCTDGTNSHVMKKEEKGRASQTEHGTRLQAGARKFRNCVFLLLGTGVPNGTFVSLVEVSFVDFPNWSAEAPRRAAPAAAADGGLRAARGRGEATATTTRSTAAARKARRHGGDTNGRSPPSPRCCSHCCVFVLLSRHRQMDQNGSSLAT